MCTRVLEYTPVRKVFAERQVLWRSLGSNESTRTTFTVQIIHKFLYQYDTPIAAKTSPQCLSFREGFANGSCTNTTLYEYCAIDQKKIPIQFRMLCSVRAPAVAQSSPGHDETERDTNRD